MYASAAKVFKQDMSTGSIESGKIHEIRRPKHVPYLVASDELPHKLSKIIIDNSKYHNIQTPEKYVGYADLPNQIFRYCSMTGFDFNLMVVGESGLGKSTFINSMFCTDIYVPVKYSDKQPPISNNTMEIHSSTFTINENGVPLRLTMIDTPGFGDCVNNSDCWEKISSYIDKCNQEYLDWDNATHRSPIHDMRVHCCIYFVSPSGHKLKPLDIEILLKLYDKTNVIPVIARADTLTPEDLQLFKRRIVEDLKANQIQTYDFSDILLQDIEDKSVVEDYVSRYPFAIVSSNHFAEINGKAVRCRKYPWGICEVDNLSHSDFIPLRNLLFRTCTCYLIDITHNYFYENFRSKRLTSIHFGSSSSSSPLNVFEQEKSKQATRLTQAKKEMEDRYHKRQEELKNMIKEKEMANATLAAQHDSDGSKFYSPEVSPHPDNISFNKEASIEDKKKDKKKKIF